MTDHDRHDDDRRLIVAALVGVQVCFGLNYLAAKLALRELAPQALAVLRIAGGAVCLLLIARVGGRRFPRNPADLARLAVYAFFGVTLNQVLFIEGLHRTTPTHSSLIITTIPVSTLLFAVLLRRELLTARKLVAPVLAVAGVVLIVQPQGALLDSTTAVGDLLTLANCMSFSFFLVLSKPLLRRVDSLASTAVLMSFGTLGVFAIGGPELFATDFGAVSATTWWLMAYIVLFPTAIAYWLQYWALARTDSSVVAFFVYLQPVIATTLSVLVLDERPGLPEFAGGALIFLGVWLAVRRQPQTPTTQPSSSA